MCFNVKNIFIFDDNFMGSSFWTKKNRDRVIDNNFEKGKRAIPIWFSDIHYKFNYSGIFLGFPWIINFEFDFYPFYQFFLYSRIHVPTMLSFGCASILHAEQLLIVHRSH